MFFFLSRSLSLYYTGQKTPQALGVKGEGRNALGGGGGGGGRRVSGCRVRKWWNAQGDPESYVKGQGHHASFYVVLLF